MSTGPAPRNQTTPPTSYGTASENMILVSDYTTIDPTLQFLWTADKNRLDITALFNQFFGSLIGEIKWFACLPSAIPAQFLVCDGTAYKKTDYPQLYSLIGDVFSDTSLGWETLSDDTQFRLPDMRERFIRGFKQGGTIPFGQAQDDMMRKILGSYNGVFSASTPPTTTGSLSATNVITRGPISGNGNADSDSSFNFDSSMGVEGQLGTSSPNVGAETRPKNVTLTCAIRAKLF